MDGRTPKRPRLSACSLDFISKLVSLHKDVLSEVNDLNPDPRSALMSLLSYGMDVNTSLRVDPTESKGTLSQCPFLNLCAVAGDVNCDIEDVGSLAGVTHARSTQLIQILTHSSGSGINCPTLLSGEKPLSLNEVQCRFDLIRALTSFGSDTNKIKLSVPRCEFCWNLQLLTNFGFHNHAQEKDENETSNSALMLRSLLAPGYEVNGRLIGGQLLELEEKEGKSQRIAELLSMVGNRVNSNVSNDL